MGRLTQQILAAAAGQVKGEEAHRLRVTPFSTGLDDLLEITDLATLEAFVILRSAAQLLRWRLDLTEESHQQLCQMASISYFTDFFPLARQLGANKDDESNLSSWLADRLQNLSEQLASLGMPVLWANLLSEAESVFSGHHLVESSRQDVPNLPFNQLILRLEKVRPPDPRVVFLADFLTKTLPNIEPVWLENQFYRLYLAVRLRLSWLEKHVAVSEFAEFRLKAAQLRNYDDLALGLTRDLIFSDQVTEEEEQMLNFVNFGLLSSTEQFYLAIGSEACRTADYSTAEMIQSRLGCT